MKRQPDLGSAVVATALVAVVVLTTVNLLRGDWDRVAAGVVVVGWCLVALGLITAAKDR